MGEEKKGEKAISRRKYLGAVGGLAAAAAVGWGLAGYLASKPTAPAAVKTVTETKTITAMPTPAVTPTPVRKLKIGFSPYYVDDDWYRVDVKGAEFYAEDHGNELLILNPHGDPETQIKNVKYMVESGIDALIISPTDPKALTETIDWVAKDKKIPVICTNTDAETASIAITVMSGTVEIGEMIAEAMVNAVKKDGVELEGDVFVASGPYGETQARMLWEGYNNVLGKYSGLKLQRFECPTWGADEAQKAIVDAIKGIGKPLMILGTNMTTTLGCVEGVKRAGFAIPRGKSGHIYVGGFDCSKAGAEYIKEGLLDAVSDVPNPHWEGLGQYFARLVVEAFGHRWLRTGGIIVTPENVDTYEGWYVLVDKWLV